MRGVKIHSGVQKPKEFVMHRASLKEILKMYFSKEKYGQRKEMKSHKQNVSKCNNFLLKKPQP